MSKYRDMNLLLIVVFFGSLGLHSSYAQNVSSQSLSGGAQQFISLGGAAHALAEFCGSYSKSQLADMKDGQLQKSKEMGIAADEFEEIFVSAMEGARKRLKSASPEKRQEACNSSEAMQLKSSMGERP